ncbi:MAG: phenylalanine--tRNA ligase subunit beta [Ignavibacteriae bacterium]|nr:phenylalanine--tRNA ligase subunit beta [Ignavibacteriota bacterium]
MYISYKWLQEFVEFDYTPVELEHILTMLGIEVESTIDYSKKYENFYTAKVLSAEKHPNANKLTLCKISLGNEVKQVVCGAPNVASGQVVVLGVVGAVVPQNGMVLEKREVRKIVSEGMLCSQFELELGDDKSGIWILPDNAGAGIPLAKYLNFDDIVFDISVTPNRADCLSHLGIAREIAAYSGIKIKLPEVKLFESEYKCESEVKVIIEDSEKCPRYTARAVKNLKVKESPEWMKNRLTILGMRPINSIVDATNYVLLECGQPLHAFDLNNLGGKTIIVKTSGKGEKFTTLDSKVRVLDNDMLMICDENRSVAIGGVMGGENSEINNETKDILLESAFFNPSSIRKTSKKLGIQSEASYRFERGVDIDNIVYASNRAIQLITEISGGEVLKDIIDVYPSKKENLKIKLRFLRARNIIGADIPDEKIESLLSALQFKVKEKHNDYMVFEIPSFRVDISQEIDLIEEIARAFNYDNIEPQYTSTIDFSGQGVPDKLAMPSLREKLTDYFVLIGFNQVLTQNQTDPKSTELIGSDPVKISNPLGEELSLMRTSLIPSMLKTIERNIRVGKNDLRLFEIGKSFHKVDKNESTYIDGFKERETLLVAMTGKKQPRHWSAQLPEADFYDIKGVLENMAKYFHLDNLSLSVNIESKKVFTANSLSVCLKDKSIGFIGEVSPILLKEFDIDIPVFLLEIELEEMYNMPKYREKYRAVSQFPLVRRDLAFIVDKQIESVKLLELIRKSGGSLLKDVDVFDVFSGKSIAEGKKSIAFSLSFSSYERTLIDEEVEIAVSMVVKTIEKEFSAEWRKF